MSLGGRGYGRIVVDVTSYIDDVVRVLRKANSNPAYSGLGLLTFIVSKVEEVERSTLQQT
jgi:hypothetical protein